MFPQKPTVDVRKKGLATGIFLVLYIEFFLLKEEGFQIQEIIHNHHYWVKEKAS